MTLSYVYRLYPDKEGIDYLNALIFTRNQAYNATLNLLEKSREMYKRGYSATEIAKTIDNDIKLVMRKRDDIVYKTALLQDARKECFNSFFGLVKQKKKFNLRFRDSSSFEGSFIVRKTASFKDGYISIFGKKIPVLLHRPLPKSYRVMGYRVKRELDRFFLIVNLTDDKKESIDLKNCKREDFTGMDINSGNFVFSNGKRLNFPKSVYEILERKRKKHQKILSRRVKGSKNRKKAQKALYKASRKIKNRRKDDLHKKALDVLRHFVETKFLVVEDLNISSILRNKETESKKVSIGLHRNFSHQAHGLFLNVLSYKAHAFDRFVIWVDSRDTSRTCSRCGYVKRDLSLDDRLFRCPECFLEIDRDFNASLNIKRRGSSLCSHPETGSRRF